MEAPPFRTQPDGTLRHDPAMPHQPPTAQLPSFCYPQRPVQLPDHGNVIEVSLLGGLHHHYFRQAA